MSVEEIQDKNGKDITEGDFVYTKYRGGSHEGKVEMIIRDQASAQQEGVASYPKVIYTDQHGHRVAHNPITLTKQNRSAAE
ncbi:hypothetical protein DTO013E5_432 [Penicillium roqueforti]|uniref:uncharacterized protein n=1 Tax=Penicillium roqueforti TaxID=5082 RepID=UPI00190A9B28|nr:uncharacterized protein LCP9604111_706 [Penicillium roqueforti]KAF9253180.1 hypothetical protein LCP9604111_706 [Penicillium roqueforti]KAI1838695.1 hypothetical protein CBS147337_420 [Penicillium roqueforti]KAI2680409.1 hypothetical protein CBS147355_3389 [Penicillium roqueforti]KAI2691202.1 hypothetical protein LCP963914a_1403 [Penicillium roqueforti]KAI2706811.1 hypothetical protein CBS147372_722 [Penicillium roqueforti]